MSTVEAGEQLPANNFRKKPYFGCGIATLIFFVGGFCALLISVLKSAREEALNISCLSNMRQLGVAFSQYEQDSDGRFPQSARWAASTLQYLPGSLSAKRISYHCPKATKTPYGYAFNQALSARGSSSFAEPSSVILLFESDSKSFSAFGSSTDVAWKRHPNLANFLYADGHAHHLLNRPEAWSDIEKGWYKWK